MASIDVVVPCYRYGHYLPECIESILDQAGADVRVLIIDNASTDGSGDVALRLARENSRVETRVREVNRGLVASINEGIEWASATYFMVVSADDLLAPGCFSRALAIMEQNPEITFVYGREIVMLDRNPVQVAEQAAAHATWRLLEPSEFIMEVCPPSGSIGAGAVLVRTAAQKRAGLYRDQLRFTCDLEMLMRLAMLGRVADLQAIQGVRRVHQDTLSSNLKNGAGPLLEIERAFQSYFSNEGAALPDAQQLRRMVFHNIGSCAYWRALSRLVSGRTGDSLDLWRMARRLSPRSMFFPPFAYLAKVESPLAKLGAAFRR
ncbi:MAG: glycosyltransferase [Hyphomonadaceae bacterium]|jgi:glycosyltransferase involved in cell wall biosynthesis|nr:glycosyltransferase [Hyphomonadaceae bacterium]